MLNKESFSGIWDVRFELTVTDTPCRHIQQEKYANTHTDIRIRIYHICVCVYVHICISHQSKMIQTIIKKIHIYMNANLRQILYIPSIYSTKSPNICMVCLLLPILYFAMISPYLQVSRYHCHTNTAVLDSLNLSLHNLLDICMYRSCIWCIKMESDWSLDVHRILAHTFTHCRNEYVLVIPTYVWHYIWQVMYLWVEFPGSPLSRQLRHICRNPANKCQNRWWITANMML